MNLRYIISLVGAVCVAGGASAQPSEQDLLPGLETEYPIVITPTRLKQPLPDVPASVTIITASTIQKYGVTSIVDALRLVPGMEITEPSGNDFRINYHGTNVLTPRRMNVLIDGISAYRPGFARVYWAQLPVAIEDVDRIEVTRGPNSAAYGPNSMLAIVNVITKHPKDVERAMALITTDSKGGSNATARFGATIGPTAFRITVNDEQDRGYDFLSRIGANHDSTKMRRINIRSITDLSADTSLDLQLAYVEGTNGVPFVDAFQLTFPDQQVHDIYAGGVWTKQFSPTHEFQARFNHVANRFQQTWTTCMPRAFFLPQLYDLWRINPGYANTILAGRVPSGGSPQDNALAAAALTAIRGLGAGARQTTCVNPNQDIRESRSDIELQDTYVFSNRFRMVSGIGARVQRAESQTYFNGSVSNTMYRVFGNAEYKPSPALNLNIGGYAERDPKSGSTFSPRVALNIHATDNQTLRFVVSKGTRTPDLLEQRANWSYTVTDISPPLNGVSTGRFYQSAVSPGNISSERITSKEIGYLLNVQQMGLMLDLKIFEDKLNDLISEKLQLSNFQPSNNNSVLLRGSELQTTLDISSTWSAFFNYAYLSNTNATTPLEYTQYSRHSGALGISHSFGSGLRGSLAYYGASGDGLGQSAYGRTDLTLGKTFKIEGAHCIASFIVRRLDDKSTTYFRDFGSIYENKYNDRLSILGQLKISY